MKRTFKFLVLSAAALAVAVGCQEQFSEEMGGTVPKGDFTITISTTPTTKTASDPSGNITFSVGDKVNLFHAGHSDARAYSSYENDGCFEVTEVTDGKATLMGMLSEDLNPSYTYDWFAVYPFNSETTNPENAVINFKTNITAATTEPTSSLAGDGCPLAGEAMKVKGNVTPVLTMRQVAALVAVTVMNTSEEDLLVNTVSVSSFTNAIAGKHSFKVNKFERAPTDYAIEYGYREDPELGIGFFGAVPSSPKFEQTVIDPLYSVTVNTGGVVVEPYDPVTFYVPVAPTVFNDLGDNIAIKVNDIWKPATMKPNKLMWTPFESGSDFRGVRHKFLNGKVTKFSFLYSFVDLENTACEWSSGVGDNRGKQDNYFNQSKDITIFMSQSSNVKAEPSDETETTLATMWIQSYGLAHFGPFNMGVVMYPWENEGPVFVIPVQHISAGSKVVMEADIQITGDGPYDGADNNKATPEDLHTQGAGAYYMMEYSLNQGQTWTPANVISEGRYEGPVKANFCFPKANYSDDKHHYPVTAECPINTEFSEKTFLFRIKCVNAEFNVSDVNANRTTGSRTPYVVDLQQQPGMNGGQFKFNALNGDKYGIFARISVQ